MWYLFALLDSFGNSDSQFKGIIDFDKFSVVGEICGVKYFIEDSVKVFATNSFLIPAYFCLFSSFLHDTNQV